MFATRVGEIERDETYHGFSSSATLRVGEPLSALGPDFYDAWVAMAQRLGADPIDLMRVAYAETGVSPTAHDPRSNAGGLIGFMPSTLRGLGWKGSPEEFRELSATQQVPYVEAYYRPYKGRLRDDGLVYVANFLPAYLSAAVAGGDSYVLTRQGEAFYDQNQILDRDGDGEITVGDLRRHLAIQDRGTRYDTIERELRARGGRGHALGTATAGVSWLTLLAVGGGAYLLRAKRPDLWRRIPVLGKH